MLACRHALNRLAGSELLRAAEFFLPAIQSGADTATVLNDILKNKMDC